MLILCSSWYLLTTSLKLHALVTSLDDCIHLQNHIIIVVKRCVTYKLTVNAFKWRVIIFSLKFNKFTYNYKYNNTLLDRTLSMKYLVATVARLTFNDSINAISHSTLRMLDNIALQHYNYMCFICTFETRYAPFIWSPIYKQPYLNKFKDDNVNLFNGAGARF